MSKVIVNVSTGEVIKRDLTAEELAQQAIDEATTQAIKAEAVAKAATRQALLNKLGITEEEARLLLS